MSGRKADEMGYQFCSSELVLLYLLLFFFKSMLHTDKFANYVVYPTGEMV